MFTLAPGDPESGGVYRFDRRSGVFYGLNFEHKKWGGYSIAEFEELNRACRLTVLAQRPGYLENYGRGKNR